MAAKKISFKAGTNARKARSKVAEELKQQGDTPDVAFGKATNIVKKVKTSAATKRLGKHGLKKGT